ncbi:hypothetical protein BC936DRAFT_144937 [Jimgerdemannia flammicorona]|uniref:Rhodanese domain-containing protein n=1 Tax=Jimgerdemannia flammicorona TaxID=994334 RepID=A0A433DBB2_9FUNG|nr:hypothetical protein BC936DRAFT_144937 [Jimgerdemannia flammicorona]
MSIPRIVSTLVASTRCAFRPVHPLPHHTPNGSCLLYVRLCVPPLHALLSPRRTYTSTIAPSPQPKPKNKAKYLPPALPPPDPSSYRTLAFYKFHPLDPSTLPALRTTLLADLGTHHIVGRVYISTEGINAQLAVPEHNIPDLRRYVETVLVDHTGPVMDFNFGTEHRKAFRALHVRIRKQLVVDGLDPKTYNLGLQPNHLPPPEWHVRLANYEKTHGRKPVLIDMRNHYESEIGHFEGAIRPDVETFRGSVKAMREICKDLPKDEEVFMYCTGGIRCSKAGAILRSTTALQHVHLVAGGITAYGRWIRSHPDPPSSLYHGKNFTFDSRLGEPITNEVLSRCHVCSEPANTYTNCANAGCNLLMIACAACRERHAGTCGRKVCVDVVKGWEEGEGGRVVEVRELEEGRPVIGTGLKSGVHRLRVRPRDVLGGVEGVGKRGTEGMMSTVVIGLEEVDGEGGMCS